VQWIFLVHDKAQQQTVMQMAKSILVVQWIKNCLTVLVAVSFSVRTLLSCAFISAFVFKPASCC
jgi:hypothetical protein